MNVVPLMLFIIFGIIIISGYINSIIKGIDLWNGINNNFLRKIYIFMIILSSMSGMYLMYFYSTNKNNGSLLYSGLLFLLVFSAIWAWAPYYKEKIVLFMVALGSFILLINNSIKFENNTEHIIAIVACVILFVQTFGFDFMLWSGVIFNKI